MIEGAAARSPQMKAATDNPDEAARELEAVQPHRDEELQRISVRQ